MSEGKEIKRRLVEKIPFLGERFFKRRIAKEAEVEKARLAEIERKRKIQAIIDSQELRRR